MLKAETMSGDETLQVPRLPWLVDWRARRIADPVARLRYLRSTARGAAGRRPRKWRMVAAVLVCVGAATQTVSDASLRDKPDRLFGPDISFLGPRSAAMPHSAVRLQEPPLPEVWLVEDTAGQEIYSNGLRVEKRYLLPETPPNRPAFRRISRAAGLASIERRREAFGIVFHTTESHVAPFEREQNLYLKRIGEELLTFTQRKRAYHYVIDRFGRVFNVVPPGERAHHAGHSVWADERWVYVSLNHSFLGVSFEGRTGEGGLTRPQLHAGRILTDMLRARYRIPAALCVTHAQVSVNPDFMLIGYHTDWAAGFPFAALGLTDNYAEPVSSIELFGFGYDSVFLNATGGRPWRGIALAEESVRRAAASRQMAIDVYRNTLRKQYREWTAALAGEAAAEERN